MMDMIAEMPKVDLHLHLDGCVRPSTLLDFARIQGVQLPADDPRELLPYMQASEATASLTEYLQKFGFVLPMLQTGEALERVAYETVESAAADNCLYIEVRWAPMLHTNGELDADGAIRHVLDGLRRGEARFGVKARAIVICMRHHDEATNLRAVEAAARFAGQGVVAVDLAGDEAGFPPGLFRGVFAMAAKLGLPATIHAGEAGGPGNVREAIEGLGAVRIGHGVRIREDAAVMQLVKERRIPLEMCPVSNIQTKAVSGWDDYPIRDYIEQGVTVTVHTDNPTVSATTITREFRELAARFGFTPSELAALALNGAQAAFLPQEEKAELVREMKRRIEALGISC
ncbi:adenosine deaminase [Paenibacillus darwinianus]|nr:adenosine deaminase [Paenibacillus darwinianus]